MPSKDKSFDELKRFANAMIGDTATTLSTKEGKFANAYDNIWYPNTLAAEISVGVLNFPAEYGLTNNYSRKMVSDHIPVYFIVSQINEQTGYIDPSKTLLPITEATSKVLGNKNSKIYHLPHCKSFEQMKSSRNKVAFNSESEAISSGYRKARNCN